MNLITHQKLPLEFDAARLKAELNTIPPDAWQSHYNSLHYDWGWAAVPLISADGSPSNVRQSWGDNMIPTPLLKTCPYIQEVISAFKCEVRRVRLLRLASGAKVKKHVDAFDKDTSLTRIHIPITTHEDVIFWMNHEFLKLVPGQSYYVEVGLLHCLENNSPIDRVHLVVDCKSNQFIDDLLGFDIRKYREERREIFKKIQAEHKRRDNLRRLGKKGKKALAMLLNEPGKFIGRIAGKTE